MQNFRFCYTDPSIYVAWYHSVNAVRFRAAMTRGFRAREARFRRTRDCKRCGVCKRVWKKTGKKMWKTQRERKVASRAQTARLATAEGGEGRGRPVGQRWNHKSVKMFCNFEIRRVPAGLRQSALPETANRWAADSTGVRRKSGLRFRRVTRIKNARRTRASPNANMMRPPSSFFFPLSFHLTNE